MASYLTLTEANTLASGLQPPVAKFIAATDAQKTGALEEATRRVDLAFVYQGRKYDPVQELQFPRSLSVGTSQDYYATLKQVGGGWGGVGGSTDFLDWDDVTKTVVVPKNVKLAVLREAEAILAGDAHTKQAEARRGLASQSAGSHSESYAPGGMTGDSIVCASSWHLIQGYRIRTGRIL